MTSSPEPTRPRGATGTPSTAGPRPGGLFYGWYIVLGGAFSNFLVSAISVWGFGVFIKPLQQEFGWSSAVVAAGFSIRSFQQGSLAPFVGILVDRIGPRKMLFIGTVLLSLGFFLFSAAQNIPMYFAASLLIALGQSLGTFTAFTTTLMRWFSLKRGRAMGILNAGNGGGYFLVPAIAFLVSTAGWREALLVCGAANLLVGLPVAYLLRDAPSQMGLAPDGRPPTIEERSPTTEAVPLEGASLSEALHSRAFYHLAFAQALGGGAVNAWIVHTIPHLQNVGFSLGAATAIGVGFAACQVAFRPAAGFLGDRVGRRRLFIGGFVFLTIGLVVFSQLRADRLWLLPMYYLTFAFGQASWVVLQAATVADYFGPRRFATISGLANLFQTPVGVLAPIVAGAAFDRSGTYSWVFLLLAVGPALSAASLLLAPKPSRVAS
ncbi:MAG: MFS transporter [Dehalococcoidia bacterium]